MKTTIKAVRMDEKSDGRVWVWVSWSDGSTTAGDVKNTHMRALLARAAREGVR